MTMRMLSLCLLMLSFTFPVGCTTPQRTSNDVQREKIETDLRAWGIENDPTVEEQRAAIEASIAREDSSPILDAVELRTTAVHETDDKLQMLARVPLERLFAAGATRDANRAATQVEIAQLGEVALEQRVRMCVPSLDELVYQERLGIFDQFAERQHALLEWNREMRSAGLLEEVGAERFELAGQVRLARGAPSAPVKDSQLESQQRPFAALPFPVKSARLLQSDVAIVREQLLLNHPRVSVLRARGQRYESLARKERVGRYPSLRFVEFGFEPTTFPGETRQYDAQLAFEIPFGREARASERRYRALATGQRSAERALIDESIRETRAAVEEINEFRRRGDHWRALLDRADAAEKVADRWQRERLADPGAIARLLDEVYDARIAVLEARERAGYAACAVLATTGTTVDEWPL